MLERTLLGRKWWGVDEKLDACRDLLTKQVVTLRGQFASIRKTLDANELFESLNVLQGHLRVENVCRLVAVQNHHPVINIISSIAQSLDNQRVQGVDEKLDACRDLLTKQVVTRCSEPSPSHQYQRVSWAAGAEGIPPLT
jgi:hypothetical protein